VSQRSQSSSDRELAGFLGTVSSLATLALLVRPRALSRRARLWRWIRRAGPPRPAVCDLIEHTGDNITEIVRTATYGELRERG